MLKKTILLILLLTFSTVADNFSRMTEGGYDMRRYIIADKPNLRDCDKFSEIPRSEVEKYMIKYPHLKKIINNNRRICKALIIQTIEMDYSRETQDIWFDNASYLLLEEKDNLLKEECETLYKPMMQFVYSAFKKDSLLKMKNKLSSCLQVLPKGVMRIQIEYLLIKSMKH